ncbi:transketolase family protein [Rhizomonospora bruguierae]|uniref:transketolase family protein n=1 Tax=Rhizomonospora bruguierae TaxID=1581705 RepID=UPI001BCDF516|nr:transketolase [Micromonospora sp. NBRC 107566]
MRERFIETTTALLDEDPRTALVLADISAAPFEPAARQHPERVVNVGIREQLMIGTAGGLALTGLRPIAHSYATFLVDRAYEQVKLDLDHQGSGAVLVSVGASYDGSQMGRTHFSPGDVALLDTLSNWTVHVPGHPDEVEAMLRAAAPHDERVYIRLSTQQNSRAYENLAIPRRGDRGLVLAVGPMLAPVLAATEGLDVTVGYVNTPRPLDEGWLRSVAQPSVVLVEPYLAGTSTATIAHALRDLPHRVLALGVGREDLHRYGTPADHARWHGLDPAGLRATIGSFIW